MWTWIRAALSRWFGKKDAAPVFDWSDPIMLAALREADALAPDSTPLAPPERPEPGRWYELQMEAELLANNAAVLNNRYAQEYHMASQADLNAWHRRTQQQMNQLATAPGAHNYLDAANRRAQGSHN